MLIQLLLANVGHLTLLCSFCIGNGCHCSVNTAMAWRLENGNFIVGIDPSDFEQNRLQGQKMFVTIGFKKWTKLVVKACRFVVNIQYKVPLFHVSACLPSRTFRGSADGSFLRSNSANMFGWWGCEGFHWKVPDMPANSFGVGQVRVVVALYPQALFAGWNVDWFSFSPMQWAPVGQPRTRANRSFGRGPTRSTFGANKAPTTPAQVLHCDSFEIEGFENQYFDTGGVTTQMDIQSRRTTLHSRLGFRTWRTLPWGIGKILRCLARNRRRVISIFFWFAPARQSEKPRLRSHRDMRKLRT